MPRLSRKTTLSIGCFLVFASAIHYAPLVAFMIDPPPPPNLAGPPPTADVLLAKKYVFPIGKMSLLLDISGSLEPFYRALARTEAGQPGAITRVLHYGDSPTTADLITADLRSLLQRRFGDSGHGFVLVAKPWAWYGHRGVGIRSGGWKIEAASQTRAADRLHGLGGVSFVGWPGAYSRITLPDDRHTSLDVYYLRQPGGGVLHIETGTRFLAEIDTAGETAEAAFTRIALPDGTAEISITVPRGSARVFGVSFEKSGPGIVYSSLGLNGASVQMALYHFEPAHWSQQLRHADPDLVVVNYGSNESFFGSYLDKYYPDELRRLLERLRSAVPDASILVMSPMDRAELDDIGNIMTPRALPRLINIQRRTALDAGCAFFNTFEAMGGAGTMARWYTGKPRLVSADFLHPTPQGAARVGALVHKSLMEGYELWKADRQ